MSERGGLNWQGVAVLTAAAVVFGGWGWLLATWPPNPPTSAADVPATPTATPDAEEPVVVVLGDSFTGGSTMNDGPEWPIRIAEQLGWLVFTDAVGGSGYVTEGLGRPFAERVDNLRRYDADMVVLAGGINDLSQPTAKVVDAAERVIEDTRQALPDAEVVLLSPFANGEPSRDTLALARDFQSLADRPGVSYVDTTQMLAEGSGLIGSDGLHPTDAGHERLADQLAPRLSALLSLRR